MILVRQRKDTGKRSNGSVRPILHATFHVVKAEPGPLMGMGWTLQASKVVGPDQWIGSK